MLFWHVILTPIQLEIWKEKEQIKQTAVQSIFLRMKYLKDKSAPTDVEDFESYLKISYCESIWPSKF